MTISLGGSLKAIGVIVALAFAVTGSVVVFRPVLADRERLERIRNGYRHDNDEILGKITDLKSREAFFTTDPDYVEQVGRRENRVRPNELIFVFPRKQEP